MVFIYVYDVLKLRDLCVVCPLKVYLACLSFNLSKLVFIVSSLNVLVTITSADIGSSALVLLLYRK